MRKRTVAPEYDGVSRQVGATLSLKLLLDDCEALAMHGKLSTGLAGRAAHRFSRPD